MTPKKEPAGRYFSHRSQSVADSSAIARRIAGTRRAERSGLTKGKITAEDGES
jgi:hypothetical protein